MPSPVPQSTRTLARVDGIFIVRMGRDGDDERARREAEWHRLRGRYVRHFADAADVDEATAERVVAALFDHPDSDGHECPCGCHPRLSAFHDDGFDCPCGWDDARRAAEARSLDAWARRCDHSRVRASARSAGGAWRDRRSWPNVPQGRRASRSSYEQSALKLWPTGSTQRKMRRRGFLHQQSDRHSQVIAPMPLPLRSGESRPGHPLAVRRSAVPLPGRWV